MNLKKAVRRFLTLTLTLAMVSGLGLTARAAESCELWVGGTEVTADNLSGDGWSYDAGTRTLTLTNYTYTGPGQSFDVGDGKEAAAILYRGEEPLTIRLAGENSVTQTEDACAASYGVFSEADLTFLGSGSLTAVSGDAEDASYGITSNHRIAVLSGAVTAASGKAQASSCGFFALTGFAVEGGTVTAAGGEAGMSRGIVAGIDTTDDYPAFTVKDGTVTATGGPGSSESEGIFCFQCDITISGGTVTAVGGPSTNTSYGIYDFGVLSITGGTVKTTGGEMTATDETINGVSMGIFDHEGGILISGGTVTAVGNTAIPAENGDRALSHGIQSDGPITVSGGQVTTEGGGGLISVGLFSETDLTVSGGQVSAISGTGTEHSMGIEAGNSIVFEGGAVEAKSGRSSRESDAMIAASDIFIRGANTTVTALGGESDGSSTGLICMGGLTVEAGTVKAEGGLAPLSLGIAGKTVEVKAGTVTADGGTVPEGKADETASIGMESLQGVTISGGTVTAGSKPSEYSCGIYIDEGELAVSGGTVTATGDPAAGISYGVSTDRIDIRDGISSVTASGGKRAFDNYTLTNAIPGTGWTDTEGTQGEAAIPVNEDGGTLDDFRKVEFATCSLWVGGETVTRENLSGDGWSFTPKDGDTPATLTLDNYSYSGPGHQRIAVDDSSGETSEWPQSAAICYAGEDPLTLELIGTSEVTQTGNDAENGESTGVFSLTDLTITGEGSLTANGGPAMNGDAAQSCGIMSDGSLTVAGGTVIAQGDKSGGSSAGIGCAGDLTVAGKGAVTAGGGPANVQSFGISGWGGLTVRDNGSVKAAGGEAAKSSVGIDFLGNLTVCDNGSIKAAGGKAAEASGGVSCASDLTVRGNGSVTADGGPAGVMSVGLSGAGGTLAVEGGTLTAAGGTVENPGEYGTVSCGFIVVREVTVSGGTVTAAGGAGADVSAGILNNGGLTLSGGTVTAAGGAVTGEESRSGGIISREGQAVVIQSGVVSVTASGTTQAIYGMVKNSIAGTGWTDAAGTQGRASIPVNNEGGTLDDFGKVQFVKPQSSGGRSGGGGGGGGAAAASNPVTVPSSASGAVHGKVTASMSNAKAGDKVTLTVTPDEGYQLDKVTVTDKNGKEIALTEGSDGAYTFTMPATAVTVTATFKAVPDTEPAPEPAPSPIPEDKNCAKDASCPISKFSDASPDQWYHDGVHWALENGVMNGVSDTRFAPEGTATRAMVVTMLWRLEGEPEGKDNPFTDVADDAWYAGAVSWAAETGVVNGVSITAFAPDTPVTREQLVTILCRYAQAKNMDVSVGEETNILSYDDAFEISDWAMPAMQWACGAGILNGRTESTLEPGGTATRAEIAVMFQRFEAGASMT